MHVLVEQNWSFENGYNDALVPSEGDGNGFKLGGSGTGDGNHLVWNNLAWHNFASGFDDNSAHIPVTLYNNTAYTNGTNFAFYSAVANILRNNLALSPILSPSTPRSSTALILLSAGHRLVRRFPID